VEGMLEKPDFLNCQTMVLVATPVALAVGLILYLIPPTRRMHAATSLLSFAPILASITLFCLDSPSSWSTSSTQSPPNHSVVWPRH
jgi:hypothetical protein